MKLADLLTMDAASDARFAALEVGGISADSRTIKPGDLFVAVAGAKDDGLRFVDQAVASGAAAIMAERMPPMPLPDGVAFIKVGDARRALALAAAKFFSRQPDMIAAVTGTSGKTSVAAFTRQIWAALGERAASIGTVGLVSPTREVYGSLTTPDPIALHRALDELARRRRDPSRHGGLLARARSAPPRRRARGRRRLHQSQPRPSRLSSDARGLSRSQARLFTDLIEDRGAAVIAADHEHADAVIAAARQRALRLLTVGRRGESIRLLEIGIDGFAQVLKLGYAGREYAVRLPLPGAFQVENAMVAAGLVIATGGEPAATFAALAHLKGAKGRLELVGENEGAPIFVDYAHKPDALAKALEALRPYASHRLIVVFGCGGDRDAGKRPMMGAIAAQMADRVVVTDDNPRTENPAAIRAAILQAAPGAIEIGDRREAICASVAELRRGDVLLVAGKGHETGQIIGKQVLPFSDHEAVAAALAGRVA